MVEEVTTQPDLLLVVADGPLLVRVEEVFSAWRLAAERCTEVGALSRVEQGECRVVVIEKTERVKLSVERLRAAGAVVVVLGLRGNEGLNEVDFAVRPSELVAAVYRAQGRLAGVESGSLERINRFAQAIATQFTLPDLTHVAIARTRELCEADGASLLLVDPSTGELWFDAVEGGAGGVHRAGSAAPGKGRGRPGRLRRSPPPRRQRLGEPRLRSHRGFEDGLSDRIDRGRATGAGRRRSRCVDGGARGGQGPVFSRAPRAPGAPGSPRGHRGAQRADHHRLAQQPGRGPRVERQPRGEGEGANDADQPSQGRVGADVRRHRRAHRLARGLHHSANQPGLRSAGRKVGARHSREDLPRGLRRALDALSRVPPVKAARRGAGVRARGRDSGAGGLRCSASQGTG